MLVTGGSGYLGSRLARLAVPAWQVTATYHAHPVEIPGVDCLPLDLRDAGAVQRLAAQTRPRVIIHTACSMVPDDLEAVIVAGTGRVAEAARSVGARLVHLSSDVMIDGEHAPYRESDPPQPITPYGRAKAQAEGLVCSLPDAVAVRTSLIYGFDPPDPRTAALLAGSWPVLFTDEYRCPVYVYDLAAALLELAAMDYRGVLNVAGSQRLSRYDFGVRLVRALGGEPSQVKPGLSHESGLTRPRDCTLDISLAQRLLRTPLRGVDEVLAVAARQCLAA